MCFSSDASFAIGAMLLAVGATSLKKISEPTQILFAGIPVLFGLQQLIEGALWLSFSHSGFAEWKTILTYGFLVFAEIIWPVWVPIAYLLLEKDVKRKKILRIFLFLGTALALYFVYCFFNYSVSSSVGNHHIHYSLLFPYHLRWISGVLYFLPATISPFISSIRTNRLIGVLLIATFIVSRFFFRDYLISVWCFFAAIISVLVLIVMRSLNRAST